MDLLVFDEQRRTVRLMTTVDPLGLAHRIHVSLIDGGYTARCTCGWVVTRATREARQEDIDGHHAVPRSRGSHGLVSEGD